MTADGLDSSILDSDPEGRRQTKRQVHQKARKAPNGHVCPDPCRQAQKEAAGAAGGGGKKEVSMKAAM